MLLAFGMSGTRVIGNGHIPASPATGSSPTPGTTSRLTFTAAPKDHYQHYDSVTIAQYDARGRVVSNRTYNWNIAVASGPLPAGWGEDMGLQFQMDIANAGASMTEYVDSVILTAW